jgi:hypothetical protein
MNHDDFTAELEAKLTPDLKAAISALCSAMPEASDAEIAVLVRDRFPEVYEKNRPVLREMGLAARIEAEREI